MIPLKVVVFRYRKWHFSQAWRIYQRILCPGWWIRHMWRLKIWAEVARSRKIHEAKRDGIFDFLSATMKYLKISRKQTGECTSKFFEVEQFMPNSDIAMQVLIKWIYSSLCQTGQLQTRWVGPALMWPCPHANQRWISLCCEASRSKRKAQAHKRDLLNFPCLFCQNKQPSSLNCLKLNGPSDTAALDSFRNL